MERDGETEPGALRELSDALGEHLRAAGFAARVTSFDVNGSRSCAVALAVPGGRIALEATPVAGATRFYRRTAKLAWCYSGDGAQHLAVVDAALGWLFAREAALLDALAARPESSTVRPLDLRAAPGVAAWATELPIRAGTVRRDASGELELVVPVADAGEVHVRPVRAERQPYAAGAHLAARVEGVEVVRALHDVALAIVAHEAEVLSAAAAALGPAPASAGPVGVPPGRLFRHPGAGGRSLGIVALTSPCYANCIFCGQETTREWTFADTGALLESVSARDFAPEKVVVVGWEPLSHPGVLDLVAALRSTGVREVELMTTGVPLGDDRLVDALVAAGLTSVAVPLYSHLEHVNDLVMRRAGAYRATLRGLERLRRASVELFVHALVLRQNLHDVDPLCALVRDRLGARFVAAPARSKGRYADTAFPYAALEGAVRVAPVVGAPLCLVPRMAEDPDLDLGRPLQETHRDVADAMRGYFMQELTQAPECGGCTLRRACTGYVRSQAAFEPGMRVRPR